MSGLLFLTSEDFFLGKGQKGNLLCTNIPGFSLVLFYSTQCGFCQNFIPVFKKLPGTLGGCQFGMINVSQNKKCVEMSQHTLTPIKYVPYILLYIDGKPFMVYKGEGNEAQIRQFIVDISNNIQKKQNFSKERVKEDTPTGIPEYTIGKPVIGGKDQMVCYLTNEEAYNKK